MFCWQWQCLAGSDSVLLAVTVCDIVLLAVTVSCWQWQCCAGSMVMSCILKHIFFRNLYVDVMCRCLYVLRERESVSVCVCVSVSACTCTCTCTCTCAYTYVLVSCRCSCQEDVGVQEGGRTTATAYQENRNCEKLCCVMCYEISCSTFITIL